MNRRHTPLLLAVSLWLAAPLPAFAGDDPGWEQYAEKGKVTSYKKSMEGTKVLAMRGVAVIDVPIEKVVGVYLDATKATSWVDLLIQLDERKIPGGDDAVERHIYDMPWPASDREFVFRRHVVWEPEAKAVSISYKSQEHPDFPVTDAYVRGTDHGSVFRFVATEDGRTHVDAIAKVDPEGGLPAWVVNMVQRSWPEDSILALEKAALSDGVVPHPKVVAWFAPAPEPEPEPEAPPVDEEAPSEAADDVPDAAPPAEE